MNARITALILALCAGTVMAASKDDPLLAMVKFDELEQRHSNGERFQVLEADGWLGYDLDKLWLKADVEREGGDTEALELQALYSRAVSPFWDLQFGVRGDRFPKPSRNWGVVGLHGLAPYFLETDIAVFVGESGRSALRLEAEYELLLTQSMILSPSLEANFHGHNDRETGAGSGLSDLEAGLRLRYEIRREIAPYIGVNWERQYGNTADFTRATGGDIDDTQWVIGIRAWY